MELSEVKNYLEKYLSTLGFKLYNYQISKEGKCIILHVTIDRRKYIDLNEIGEVTNKIYNELISKLTIKEELIIDCSSAGIEKELSLDEVGEYIDEYVLISLKEPINKMEKINGYLKEVDETNLKIEINVSGRKKIIEIIKTKIAHIHLAVK